MSVVFTLGPASESLQLITALYQKADRFRLNVSHLTLMELEVWLHKLSQLYKQQGHSLPVILDLQGAKMRIGKFPACTLYAHKVTLFLGQQSDSSKHIPVPYASFFEVLEPEDIISLNDAKVKLEIIKVDKDHAEAKVLINGPLDSFKGINRAIHPIPFTQVFEKDEQAITVGLRYTFTQFAYSFILDGKEAACLRPLIANKHLIAKIERPEAMAHLTMIAKYFDELWFCRGDMGSQVGLNQLGRIQETFIQDANRLKKPKFLAGQVFEHMTHFPEPTRSEVVHLYDVIKAGFDGIVLSDETAIGAYPIQASEVTKNLVTYFKNQTLDKLGN
jgi:pyruvate kinase